MDWVQNLIQPVHFTARGALWAWIARVSPHTVTEESAGRYLASRGHNIRPERVRELLDKAVFAGYAVSRTYAGGTRREWLWMPQVCIDPITDLARRKTVNAWRRARGGS